MYTITHPQHEINQEQSHRWIHVGFFVVLVLVVLSTSIGSWSLFLENPRWVRTIHGFDVEIFGGGIYQYHTRSAAYQVIPHDLFTLIFAVPTYIIGYALMRKKRAIGNIIFISATFYLCFTYAIYTFNAVYNQLFLAYVTIMGLTFYHLIDLLKTFHHKTLGITDTYAKKKLDVMYLLLLPILMGMFWLSTILPTTLTGQIPEDVIKHGWTMVPQAIDLAFVLPLVIYAAIAYKRQKPFGYLMSYVVPLFLTLMMGAVLSKAIMMTVYGIDSANEMMIFIGSFFLFSLVMVHRNLRFVIRKNNHRVILIDE